MDKQEINALKQDIKKLTSTKKKLSDSANKYREKISSLQSELAETEKSIEDLDKELSVKEEKLKKAEYSSVLQKLDDAALNKLSKRQAELLAEHILSGTISSLLSEETADNADNNAKADVVTSSNDEKSNIDATVNAATK